MRYRITITELSGLGDEPESVTVLYADSSWNVIRGFDILTRGVTGHYRAQVFDANEGRFIRTSEVTWG